MQPLQHAHQQRGDRSAVSLHWWWNQLHVPAIFPDQRAPIIRRKPGLADEREMVAARWGMPTPPSLLKPGQIDRGVTNIRNTSSAHWRDG